MDANNFRIRINFLQTNDAQDPYDIYPHEQKKEIH
jgi:hypothetical protein